jgi:hypothetical protein
LTRPCEYRQLCVGVLAHGGLDGAWLTIQAIRLYHREVADRVVFLIVNDDHDSTDPIDLDALVGVPGVRYFSSRGHGADAARDLVFREANEDVVCCVDSYALLQPGGLAAILTWLLEHPTSRDLVQGPLLGDDLHLVARPAASPFETDGHAAALLACRRAAWPGREANARVVCHPAAGVAKPSTRVVDDAARHAGNPFVYFDAIFCLNLDDATDRWNNATRRHEQLAIVSLVQRFPGVATPENPHKGIAMAFRQMIVEAQRRGLEHLLVFEDDAVFLDETVTVMRSVVTELANQEWDLCFLGACVWSQAFPFLGDSSVLQACGPVTCTHAVAFHSRAYARLVADIPTAAHELDHWLREMHAIDQYLSRRIADGTYRALITSPRVATQPNLLDDDYADRALAARYVI